MSAEVKIDFLELLRRIETVVCPECRKKLAALDVPIAQTLKLEGLLKGEEVSKG